jgi:hypothetical protein
MKAVARRPGVRRSSALVLVAALLSVLGVAASVLYAGDSSAGASGTQTASSRVTQPASTASDADLAPAVDYSRDLTVSEAAAFPLYALYWPGESVDGEALDLVDRVVRSPSTMEQAAGVTKWLNMIDFDYGKCVDSGGSEVGCTWPIEIQEFPSCDRNLAQLADAPTSLITVDGTSAIDVSSQDGGQLEIYTSNITIAIFAPTKDDALKVASTLTPLNKSAVLTEKGDLPPAAVGALAGKLGCPGVNVAP